jgi:hypothetical protein
LQRACSRGANVGRGRIAGAHAFSACDPSRRTSLNADPLPIEVLVASEDALLSFAEIAAAFAGFAALVTALTVGPLLLTAFGALPALASGLLDLA